jgi:lambda family phage tail tape measure protein
MDDIAKLGFEIDTSPLVNATKASATAAAQIGKVGDAADATSKKVTGAGRSAQAAAGAIGAVGNAAGAAAPKVQAAGKAQDALAQALGKTTTAATAEARAAQAATAQTERLGAAAGQAASRTAALAGVLQQVGNAGQSAVSKINSLSQAFGIGTGSAGGMALTGALSTSTSLLGGLTGALGRFGPIAASTVTVVGGVAAAVIGLQAGLASVQDRWRSYEGQLKNTLGTTTQARQAIDALFKSAQASGISFDSTVQSFNRLARNATELGASNADILKLSETIQKLGVVSGASQGEIGSGMLQLSQALAAGRLNGDELRSIMENMPALAKAIADGLGVSVGALRAMGAQGELTGDKVFRALLSGAGDVQKQFEDMPDTTERAFQRVSDSWSRMLARMGEKANSSGFIQAILNATNRVINAMTPGGTPAPPEVRRFQELQAEREQFKDLPGVEGQRKRASIEAEIRLLEPRVNELRAKAQAEADKAAADEAARPALSIFSRGVNAAKAVQTPFGTRREIEDQIVQIENALIAAGLRGTAATVPADQRPNGRQAEELERALSSLRQKLLDAAGAADKFGREASDFAEQQRLGGGGGGAGIVAEAQGLARSIRLEGGKADTSSLIARVANSRAAEAGPDIAAIRRQETQQRKLIDTIGQTRDEVVAAEVAQEALDFRFQRFGTITTPAVEKAVKDYATALRGAKDAQNALADAKFVQGMRDQIAVMMAGNRVLAQGDYAVRRAEAEARARQADRDRPGAGAMQMQQFEIGESRSIEQRLQSMREQRSLTERLALLPDRWDRRSEELDFRIRQAQRGVSPERAAELEREMRAEEAARIRLDDAQAVRGVNESTALTRGTLNAVRGGASGFELRRLQAELRARQAEQQNRGMSSALERQFVAQEQMSTEQMLADMRMRTAETRELTAAPVFAKRQTGLNQRIRQAQRNAMPEFAGQIDQAMRAEDEAQLTAQLNEQAQAMRDQLRLQEDQLLMTTFEKDEIVIQTALFAKRNELIQQGVSLQSTQAREQLRLTEEVARGNVRLEKAQQEAQAWKSIWDEAGQGVTNSLSNAFLSAFDKSKKAGDVLRQGLSDTFRKMAADIMAQALKPLQDALFNIAKTIGASIVSSIAGPSVPLAAYPGAANGAYFAGGRASFAYGGVVNSPTMFRFAQGGVMRPGIMGEAGPEAIMPLRRGPDGRLGVSAAGAGGGGGSTYNISVNVDASGRSSSQEAQGGDAADNRGQRLGEVVASAVRAEIIQQQRPGGLLARR